MIALAPPPDAVDLVTLDDQHRYMHADGHQVPGVSSILRKAGIRPAPYVGRVRGLFGVDVMGQARIDPMEAALQRGTEVHRITRAIDETGDEFDALDERFEPADLAPSNANYVAAYHRFLAESRYRAAFWERIVYHLLFDYAGRIDAVGWLGAQRVMIDRKTDRQLHRAVWLQLAFYRMAWESVFPQWPIDATYALKLNADTTFELIPNPIERAADAYCQSAIWVARWHDLQL